MTLKAKKERKHAKESSGIAAAVSKQQAASKTPITDSKSDDAGPGNGNENPPPAAHTPEIRLAPENNVEPVASPLATSLSTAPSMTNEWTRGALAGSPGNLISLMGDSPPTQPSSYEDAGVRVPFVQRNFLSSSPASPSPPNSYRRPLSYHMDAHYQAVDSQSQVSVPAAHRRSSVHSHARTSSNPPLPHRAQAHFYGAPGLDLTLTPQTGLKAGEKGYFFGLDKLPSTSDFFHGSDTVALAGYEGGLEVHAVSKRGLTPAARLKGLRGGVIHAKILPWTLASDTESIFPLVAVVVHGPVVPQPPADDAATEATAASTERNPDMFPQQDGYAGRPTQAVTSYQTSVEVYSLKTNKLVDALLQAPAIPISTSIPIQSPVFQAPPPSGAFMIKADGGNVVVASGTTGESWVFRHLLEHGTPHRFGCAAKLWTCLQQGFRGEVAEADDKTNASAPFPRLTPQSPIIALNGRWIAYCPSSPSSQIALGAHIPVPLLGRSPGTSSGTPPHLPPVTSSLDVAISDSVVNKIMRETTQELIQGAKWVGQQGLQAWNSYWNRSTSPQSPQSQQSRSPPQQWPASRSPHNDLPPFPPTHGASGQAVSKEPGLISIMDTEALHSAATLHPLTTFTAPLGCSFLSFSPSALSLFTASSKGDVQTVWDLMKIQHTKSSPLQATINPGDGAGPQVRQVAQFSRMTVARIVEVVWAEPQGDRLAMVTERGTIHLLEMPFGASMWPPPRRRKNTQENAPESTETTGTAVSIASGALGAAYQAARPFVTRQRQNSGSVATVSGTTLKDSAAHGGRVIAASITSSIGKTGTAINQLRHTGDNRVSLPQGSHLPSSGCVAWVRKGKSHTLTAAGGGLVRSFPNKLRQVSNQSGKRVAHTSRYKEFKVPLLPNDTVSSAVRQILDLGFQEEYLDLSEHEMDAGNTLTLKARPRITSQDGSLAGAIPQAEIESSAPYQPFHTDRRVTICEYSQGVTAQVEAVTMLLANSSMDDKTLPRKKKKLASSAPTQEACAAPESSLWAFGQDISVVRRDLGLTVDSSQDIGGVEDHRALPASAIERVMQYDNQEQIVVTTRRRRGVRQSDPDEDGFFEDDCEVLDFADQRV